MSCLDVKCFFINGSFVLLLLFPLIPFFFSPLFFLLLFLLFSFVFVTRTTKRKVSLHDYGRTRSSRTSRHRTPKDGCGVFSVEGHIFLPVLDGWPRGVPKRYDRLFARRLVGEVRPGEVIPCEDEELFSGSPVVLSRHWEVGERYGARLVARKKVPSNG